MINREHADKVFSESVVLVKSSLCTPRLSSVYFSNKYSDCCTSKEMPSEFSKCYSLSVNTVILSFGMDDPPFLFFVHLLASEEIVQDISL